MGLAHHNFQLGSHLKPRTLLNWLDSSDESESEIEDYIKKEKVSTFNHVKLKFSNDVKNVCTTWKWNLEIMLKSDSSLR